jgi:hypothetical protein
MWEAGGIKVKLSISRSQESLWVWSFWSVGTYLVVEIGSFLLIFGALRNTAAEPGWLSLAAAAPVVVFLPLVWLLRLREKHGISPKRLASEWGVSTALFAVAVSAATIYAGVKIGWMDRADAIGTLVLSVLLSVPSCFFTAYYMALRSISSRASSAANGSRN